MIYGTTPPSPPQPAFDLCVCTYIEETTTLIFLTNCFKLNIFLPLDLINFLSVLHRLPHKKKYPKPIVYGFYHRWMVKFSSLVLLLPPSRWTKKTRWARKVLHDGDGLECKMEMMGNNFCIVLEKWTNSKVNDGTFCPRTIWSDKNVHCPWVCGDGEEHFYYSSSDVHCLIMFYLDPVFESLFHSIGLAVIALCHNTCFSVI